MKTANIITIDWDFFPINWSEAKGRENIQVLLPSGDYEKVPSWFLFDWGHSEAHAAWVQQVFWQTRAVGFLNAGLQMEQVFNILSSEDCTLPEEILKIFHEKRFIRPANGFYVSDSHTGVLHVIKQAMLNVVQNYDRIRVYLFDAHADVGYNAPLIYEEEKTGVVNCASWLWHCLRQEFVDEAVVVYPDWRGLKEWDELKKLEHIQELPENSLKVATWSWWRGMDYEPAMPREDNDVWVHACRSGSWTPPYLDSQFTELVSRLAQEFQKDPEFLEDVSERLWDRDQIEFEAKAMREMRHER